MISKTPRGDYRVRIYHQNRQIASATFKTKAPAMAWESAQKTALQLGQWTDPKLGATPLNEVLDEFNRARLGTISEHAYDTDEANLRLHVPAIMKRRPVNGVRKVDLEDIYATLLRTHSHATVRRFRDSLVALFRYATDRGYVSRNPAIDSKVPKGTGEVIDKVRPFTKAALTYLIESARTAHLEYANVIEFAELTGARWGELAALRVGDLRTVTIPEMVISRSRSDGYETTATKSRKSRVVPVVARAHEIATAQSVGKSPSDLLFQAPRGGPLNAGTLKRAVKWSERASGHRFHDLRHTAATRWITLGVDVKTVSVWLGTRTPPSPTGSMQDGLARKQTPMRSLDSRRPPVLLRMPPGRVPHIAKIPRGPLLPRDETSRNAGRGPRAED